MTVVLFDTVFYMKVRDYFWHVIFKFYLYLLVYYSLQNQNKDP